MFISDIFPLIVVFLASLNAIFYLNYLAHALLSFNRDEILTGNMLGDFVKGKNYLKLPAGIQHGILLHRFIDRTTDEHPMVHEAMEIFKPTFRLSAGVFTDIFFDHFLANDPRYFNQHSLLQFTHETYITLNRYNFLFDDKMSQFFAYMTQHNWLFHYKDKEGISKSLRGICKRYPRLGDAEKALEIFEVNYNQLQHLYAVFFPLLMVETQNRLDELTS